MGVWWSIDFAVVGPEPRIDELKGELPGLTFSDSEPPHPLDAAKVFHDVDVESRAFGFAVVHAGSNKWARHAIEELIARYSNLDFQGSAEADMSPEYYAVFVGRNGETEWTDCHIEIDGYGDDPGDQQRTPHEPGTRSDEEVRAAIERIKGRVDAGPEGQTERAAQVVDAPPTAVSTLTVQR